MATELLQDYAFDQLSRAIMATANSVSGTNASATTPPDNSGSGETGFFDVFRRKLSNKVQDVIQGIAAPLKRRSMYEDLPEQPVWHPQEHIEMSRLEESRKGQGHVFVACQLTNPTWCDYCGDFIWGLYKQCMRCQNCQLTSHEHCVPSVTLNCITVPENSNDNSPLMPNMSPTAASSERKHSLDSSPTRQAPLSSRPGCARMVTSPLAAAPSTNPTTDTVGPLSSNIKQNNTGTAPKMQIISRTHSLPDYHPHHHPHHLQQSSSSSLLNRDNNQSQNHLTHDPNHQHPLQQPHACVQRLPPTPSDIDQLTQGNNDSRFITPHPLSHPPPSSQSPSSSDNIPHPLSPTSYPHTTQSTTSSPPPKQDNVLSTSSNSNTVPSANVSSTPIAQMSTDDITPVSISTEDGPAKTDGEVNAEERDETDSGYRSGTIPDDKLPQVPSQATLDRQELKRKIAKYNHFVPAACFEMTGKNSFQGFIKVTMNLIRPITMELGARPPSIYELLTREHIIEENTQQVAFYMPRDTHKSLHITNETTTRDVISSLLKKFHILDHPRKFAMYEQEFSDKNKLVRLRRLADKNNPLVASLSWDPERIKNYRMVLQENETGEIVWDAFSFPELNNFLKVLEREERENIQELRHKYAYMRQLMEKRLVEFNKAAKQQVAKQQLAKSKSTDC